jgi:uncharacterized membrane protein YdjX (TVP38/TMEM64 family)
MRGVASRAAPASTWNRPWLRLSVALLLTLAAVVWLGPKAPAWREAIDRGIEWVRAAGPGAFFTAMAIVPAPLWMFTVPAGEAFAGQLTLPGVIAAALVAIAVQIALCYGLARYALRPALEKLVRRFGYSVPRLTADTALNVALLVRLTPGPPLFLQCFLLGIAEMPFRLYMIVSWLCTVPWVIGGIVLGRGVLAGNFATVVVGISLLAAAAIAVRLLRRRIVAPVPPDATNP